MRDLLCDSWVAIDGLGRKLPGHSETGSPRDDKTVGIFYFIWLGAHSEDGPYDISEITNGKDEQASWGPAQGFHHWGEPEVGYYRSDDPWVARRHASQLTNAGVDVVFLDVTNGYTYDKQLMVLADTWLRMRAEGNRTPQIAFLCNSKQRQVVDHLYTTFYQDQEYRDLWFYWDGKPLILANPDELGKVHHEFFSIRRSWAWRTEWYDEGHGKWPWIDNTPQAPGLSPQGELEQVSVAVAGHPIHSIGRSHHGGSQPSNTSRLSLYGLHFKEQWKHAMRLDPPLIFVTGWNEWVAQRFIHDSTRPAVRSMAGRQLKHGDSYFIDQYNQEFSRDIEPMRGGHEDAYYYQLVDSIRRYKGVRCISTSAPKNSISIDGDFSDWEGIEPLYFDPIGDNSHRDHPGVGSAGQYTDRSGRNDIIECRVTADDEAVYFLASCRETIQGDDDPGWMRLLIDSDGDLGGHSCDGFELVISPNLAGKSGSQIEVRVARTLLGQAKEISFQWCDHAGLGVGELSQRELLSGGDIAPDSRFLYRAILP